MGILRLSLTVALAIGTPLRWHLRILDVTWLVALQGNMDIRAEYREMREVLVATGSVTRWGGWAMGFFVDRRGI